MADYPGRQAVEERLAGRLVMVAPEAHKAFGLASSIRGLRVLTRSTGEAAEALRRLGADVCSVESSEIKSTTYALIDSYEGRSALEGWAPAPVVVFRPDFKTGSLLEALGCQMVSAEPRVARRLENKKAFRELSSAAGLPVVRTEERAWPSSRDEVERLVKGMGGNLVIQTARGHAGRRTWLWTEEQPATLPDWLTGRQVLISPLVDGGTWTTNAVVHSEGVAVGWPMRQITGEPRLSALPLASCGVGFNPPGSDELVEELQRLAQSVGELARREGFVGYFGIDAIGYAGCLQLIEMNARLTATLTVGSLAELAVGEMPLTIAHVLACLGVPVPDESADTRGQVSSGGHLVVRQTGRPLVELRGPATYRLGVAGLELVDERAGWPSRSAVTIWPAGSQVGGPEDERYKLLFSDQMLDREGLFTPFVEGVVEQLFR